MYLRQFDKLSTAGRYDIISGEINLFVKRDIDNLDAKPTINGKYQETTEGWAAVYGRGNELFFQVNTKKWKLSDQETRLTYSTLNDAHFRIENDNLLFETRYHYWMKDALISELDDPDSDHDFFAYIIWLCEPDNYKRIAMKWSKHNNE